MIVNDYWWGAILTIEVIGTITFLIVNYLENRKDDENVK